MKLVCIIKRELYRTDAGHRVSKTPWRLDAADNDDPKQFPWVLHWIDVLSVPRRRRFKTLADVQTELRK